MSLADKKILVVEDDDLLRQTLIDQLMRWYLGIPAKDGAEALEQITLSRPDAMVLDLMLPKVDGFEVLKKVRSLADPALANLPVLVFSNASDPESVNRAKQFNILEYYIKADIKLGIIGNRLNRYFTNGT